MKCQMRADSSGADKGAGHRTSEADAGPIGKSGERPMVVSGENAKVRFSEQRARQSKNPEGLVRTLG